MKLIIAGSRSFSPLSRENFRLVSEAISEAGYYSPLDADMMSDMRELGDSIIIRPPDNKIVTEVVNGGAAGIDTIGEDWAIGCGVPIRHFLPDWNKHGKAAGHIRNREMGDYADALVAVWDGKSVGTWGMIEYMRGLGKPVFVKLGGGDAWMR